MTKRKFYKTVIQVTVLSEDPFEWKSLADVDWAITDGDCVGSVRQESASVLDAQQTVDALTAMGSEPSFFGLKENGNEGERS